MGHQEVHDGLAGVSQRDLVKGVGHPADGVLECLPDTVHAVGATIGAVPAGVGESVGTTVHGVSSALGANGPVKAVTTATTEAVGDLLG